MEPGDIVIGVLFSLLAYILFYVFKYTKEQNEAMSNAQDIIAQLLKMGNYSGNRSIANSLIGDFYEKHNTDHDRYGMSPSPSSFISEILTKTRGSKDLEIDYDIILKHKNFAFRRDLVRLLFQLAAVGDGIKNDEWDYILQAMGRLKMNKRNYDYWTRYYSPLRTEEDDYSQYYSDEEKKIYNTTTASLKPYLEILGLKEGFTKQELKTQYHKLSLKHHPDMWENANRKKECEVMMTSINDAYARVMASL